LSLDGEITRLDGALLIAWFAVSMIGLARSGRFLIVEGEAQPRHRSWILLPGGLAILTAGGDLLARGIREVVENLGVSQTLLGNTVVAASIEGEEVARVVAPTRRGRGDLAVANITGTIVHFISFNAGVIALVKPLALDDPSRYLHLPVAVAATWFLCALLLLGKALTRFAGLAMLGLYGAYVAAAIVAA
jgi:cation:H+ antiporter